MKPVSKIRPNLLGNTEGKRKICMTNEELSYIAGFLDGDGCIMLQLVYRHDYVFGYQIRASIVFYQDVRNKYFLEWLKKKLKFGYIRNRNDGMSEYTIVGVETVSQVLRLIKPYLKLKKRQISLALRVLKQMPGSGNKLTPKKLLRLSRLVDGFSDLNYSKKRTNTSAKVEEFLKSHHLL
ncbi:hypothetical protein A2421_00775 [Candidatus Woesebacteria bacterium RIFOXYC1_FULL_43_18]|nr:MAG: hypothetical protein A2421_00775 [Candidatus Woesebacteria bacterium RIFOXYC1_FULL_43_18]